MFFYLQNYKIKAKNVYFKAKNVHFKAENIRTLVLENHGTWTNLVKNKNICKKNQFLLNFQS